MISKKFFFGVLLVFIILILSSGMVMAKKDPNKKAKAENSDYLIECDKEQYNVIGGTTYAYCSILSKNKNINTDIYSILEQAEKVTIGEIDLWNGTDWNSIESDNYIDHRNFKGKKTKIKTNIKKGNKIDLRLHINVNDVTVDDEFWLGMDEFELDPAISGCGENATHIDCNWTTYTGDSIDTTKHIKYREIFSN